MSKGWAVSADAWITLVNEVGEFGRQHVLDQPMLRRISDKDFQKVLDVGCGEGRFCRQLSKPGRQVIGIDPIASLIEHARDLDPQGDYRLGKAEDIAFADGTFDLVISYLTFIDIPDIAKGISEMCRVLAPGGTLLIANLNSFHTASMPHGWTKNAAGEDQFLIDRYMEEREEWVGWGGVEVTNWHRPFSAYVELLLKQDMILRHFEEPLPIAAARDIPAAALFERVPCFHVMEWQKPTGVNSAGPLREN
jgi:SAM-dependent methyltransferase